ncbi:hypothetical protein [Ornithinimicrobium kibberense]|uniref:hypothetical protein n=1 Tax=Ornithinimicrobium kibberense TaxID=282060 RepID=UPI0036164281
MRAGAGLCPAVRACPACERNPRARRRTGPARRTPWPSGARSSAGPAGREGCRAAPAGPWRAGVPGAGLRARPWWQRSGTPGCANR